MSECRLCSIPKREKLLYSDDNVYLVATKDMKGHEVRVMVCAYDHTENPPPRVVIRGIATLVHYMEKVMGNKIWHLVEDTYASIPEHWHRIACDNLGTPEELKQLADTPKITLNRVMIGIPMHNEIDTIADVVVRSKRFGDVVVYDDGSDDKSGELAFRWGAHVIQEEENRGYGYGLKRLFAYAKKNDYSFLITLDGDGQHIPEQIPSFIEALETHDVVVGNRFTGGSKVPKHRKYAVQALNIIYNVGDTQCGFRAYNRRAIEMIKITDDSFGASLEILSRAKSAGLEITDVPTTITYEDTTHSQSAISHGATLINNIFWGTIWTRPLSVLGMPALVFFIASIFFGVWTVYFYVRSQDFVFSYALISIGSLLMWMMLTIGMFFIMIQRRVIVELTTNG